MIQYLVQTPLALITWNNIDLCMILSNSDIIVEERKKKQTQSTSFLIY